MPALWSAAGRAAALALGMCSLPDLHDHRGIRKPDKRGGAWEEGGGQTQSMDALSTTLAMLCALRTLTQTVNPSHARLASIRPPSRPITHHPLLAIYYSPLPTRPARRAAHLRPPAPCGYPPPCLLGSHRWARQLLRSAIAAALVRRAAVRGSHVRPDPLPTVGLLLPGK